MPTKSFRGLIADGAIDTIPLSTNDGSTGYKITKFQIMGNAPGTVNYESIVKIYKIPQTSADGVVDFSDNTLLAAGFLEGSTSVTSVDGIVIVFDNEIFNQDVYITHSDIEGSASVNYYIEMEQIKLSLDENTVATLKDIRNIASQ
jgi:hypothetical protein